MQKNSIILVYLLTFIAGVFSSIEIKNFAGVPSNVVCAMSVCPTQTASLSKRAIPCPSVCPDSCKIVDDVCCPGIQTAVCNTTASSGSGSSSAVSSTQTSSTPLSSVVSSSSSTSVPTSTTIASSASPTAAATTASSAGSFIQPSITFAIITVAFCILKLN